MDVSDFEWDAAKAAKNIRKHGISFEIATRAFDDPYALTEEDNATDSEQRWRTIALLPATMVIVVIYSYRAEDLIRIMSARKADRKEWQRYAREKQH